MIHLAATIASALFLFWIFSICGVIIIAILSRWQTWVVIIGLGLFIWIVLKDKDQSTKPSSIAASSIVALSNPEKPVRVQNAENPPLGQNLGSNTTQEGEQLQSEANPSEGLIHRLSIDPPLVFALPRGNASLVRAAPTAQDGLRIVIHFKSRDGIPLLNGDAMEALPLLQGYLCGRSGMLEQYRINPDRLVLGIYEEKKFVDNVILPLDYCKA